MLDVHAPHHKLEGTREFLFHLFTITVGLLIATQIESCVEWRHHVHLAEEARQSLREEIEHNLKDLRDAEPNLQAWRKQIADDLKTMNKILEHPGDPAAQRANLSISAHSISLRDTAWRTAQSTGALAYMPYEEAQRYARIYQAQESLLAIEQKPGDDVAAIFGLINKFHWHENGTIPADQAAAVAEKLGIMQVHLATASAILKENVEVNQAFLEGREAKDTFEEDVH